MINEPIRYDMVGHRGVKFAERITYIGKNWTGATITMKVWDGPDTATAPRLDLSLGSGLILEYAGTDTVANHVTAGRLVSGEIYALTNPATGARYVSSDSISLSILTVIVAPTGMDYATIPYGTERGDDYKGVYSLMVDADGAGADTVELAFYGDFIVKPKGR